MGWEPLGYRGSLKPVVASAAVVSSHRAGGERRGSPSLVSFFYFLFSGLMLRLGKSNGRACRFNGKLQMSKCSCPATTEVSPIPRSSTESPVSLSDHSPWDVTRGDCLCLGQGQGQGSRGNLWAVGEISASPRLATGRSRRSAQPVPRELSRHRTRGCSPGAFPTAMGKAKSGQWSIPASAYY